MSSTPVTLEARSRSYAVALTIVRHHQDAEDIAQVAMAKAHKNAHQFRGESSPGTWIHRITVNEAITHLKRRKETCGLEVVETTIEELYDTPDEAAMATERHKKVRDALCHLSDDHRTVVERYYLAGIPHQEIADQLQVPVGTVRSRLHYALKILRGILEEKLN